MATILEFRQSGGRGPGDKPALPPTGSAEIVIFPGIRIERWEEPEDNGPAETAKPGARRPRKDR